MQDPCEALEPRRLHVDILRLANIEKWYRMLKEIKKCTYHRLDYSNLDIGNRFLPSERQFGDHASCNLATIMERQRKSERTTQLRRLPLSRSRSNDPTFSELRPSTHPRTLP